MLDAGELEYVLNQFNFCFRLEIVSVMRAFVPNDNAYAQ